MGALEGGQLFAVAVIIASTLLNAAYFLPIVHVAFFRPPAPSEADPHAQHGEAPLPIVIALVATAAGTVLLFAFAGLPLDLAYQLVGGRP
jgi:multicomponent Na+:H+ antiporter subunit D